MAVKETEHEEEDHSMTLNKAITLFNTLCEETSPIHAFRTFSSPTMRENLSIPDPIWKELEPIVKDQITAIRRKIRERRDSQQKDDSKDEATTTNGPKTVPQKESKIPAQYPSMAIAKLCQTLENWGIMDDDEDMSGDEEEDDDVY